MALTIQAAALKAGHHLRCFENSYWAAQENIVEADGEEAATGERCQQETAD